MKTEDQNGHVKPHRKSNTNPMLLICSLIVISIMVGFSMSNIRIKMVEDRDHYYTDVASWVQDVQDHVPDSEKRHTFVATVYAFVDDNVITDKEYKIIKDSYDDLKQSTALPSIHDNLKLMRAPNEFALRDTPAPLTNTK